MWRETVSAVAKLVGPKPKPVTLDDVIQAFLRHHPQGDSDYLRRAHDFGEKAHFGQKRRSGEPYFNHPIAVAHILAKSKLGLETIAAGFLHDVVEDCPQVSFDDISREFGLGLAKIVDGVTKIGKVKFRDKTDAQAENYRKMILAMSQDIRVLLVKLADRCHNMQTLEHLPERKRREISQETVDIYVPLAHRIGMSNLKTELEQLAFFFLESDTYRKLDSQLAERNRKNANFMGLMTDSLKQLLVASKVKADIHSRIKSHYSIWQKMKNKNRALDGLYDYYAFRILTNSVEDCYRVFGLLHGRWRHIPGRIKDFIATPKPNLYQSIHTTLISDQGQPFEVQVRTQMMHRIAEEGVAAHWTYKNGRLLSVGKNHFEQWLKRIAEDHREVHDTVEFLDTIKGQLQTKEILVFTPASEIKTLPLGATPLDFAYAIHTEVGHHAYGAKVDGKMVALRSELQSGSIVEIITKDSQRPSEEWLNIVKSSSARAKIRAWLRAEAKTKAVELGRTMFERELKRFKIPLKKVNKDAVNKILPDLNFKKAEDFYSAIGYGTLTPTKAVRPFLPKDVDPNQSAEDVRESRFKRAIQKISRRSKQMVLVRGHNDILVHLAKCCNPIIGDQIIGFISQGRGVTVHKKDCRTFLSQNISAERRIPVAWDAQAEKEMFKVKVRVFTEDRRGMIADITSCFADTGTNVHSLQAEVNDVRSMGIFDIGFQVKDLSHFQKVINNLRKVKGFLSYERTY